HPYSTLIRDRSGNLYGSTLYGGAHSAGALFKLDAEGTLTVLHSFTGADGSGPGSLTMDLSGNLYGTTQWGGAYNYGTVFELDTAGTETVLHHFHSGNDGQRAFFRALGAQCAREPIRNYRLWRHFWHRSDICGQALKRQRRIHQPNIPDGPRPSGPRRC